MNRSTRMIIESGRNLGRAVSAESQIEQLRTALRQAREVLDNVRGNINPERGFAMELEGEVASAIAAIDAITKA